MKEYITEQVKKESLLTLKKLLAIPSYNTTKMGERAYPPFGKGIDQALKAILESCDKMGMDTFYDPEGFFGFAEYGEGVETIGVLCHLDVVPEGNKENWDFDPFSATEHEGKLYGRGTQDNKGPMISALYGLKALIDSGETFNKKIRFIFGTDEEILGRGIHVYKKHETIPDRGFVPDSTFPLTYAEKGLLQFKLVGPGAANMEIQCGESINVVPDSAEYTYDNLEKLATIFTQLDISYTVEGEKVVVHGKSAHASAASEGKNAISLLSKGLVGYQPHPIISFIAEKIGEETNGKRIFNEIIKDSSGELTLNVGKLDINKYYSEVLIDIRIPVTYNKEEITQKIKESISLYSLDYDEIDYVPSLYVPLETDSVQTLWTVYKDKTGDTTEPLTTGGATYARLMPNMVAFGAQFPGRENLAHQENEHIILEDFYKAMDIYAEAIYQLCCK